MRRKTENYVAILGFILGMAGTMLTTYETFKPKSSNTSAKEQVEKIQRVNEDLRDLIKFFEFQQRKIARSEKIVSDLEKEEKSLRPLIAANKETIEAVLNAQAEKQRNSIWIDRIIGFLFGIAGSLIASAIWSRFHRRTNV